MSGCSCICSFNSDIASLGGGLCSGIAHLRFSVGDRVRCKTDEDEWSTGVVVGVHYHQADWDDGIVIPYQVEIDDGLLVYVPRDSDEICQQIEKAWWEVALHKHAAVSKSMFDAPGRYLVVCNTMVVNQLDRQNATLVSEAKPPLSCDVLEVHVFGDRIRGRVADPAGWMSLRSADNEKVFAVPAQSAFARRFRCVNAGLFEDEIDTDDESGVKSCSDPFCDVQHACPSDSHDKLCVHTLQSHSVGQDINERDEHGQTILVVSVKAMSLDAVREVIRLHADVNLSDACGETPLHHAVRAGEEFVSMLLEAEADPNIQTFNPDLKADRKSKTFSTEALHLTPLHLAAKSGSVSITRALLAANANPDMRNAIGKTPLHVALEEDSEAVVDVLIESGADVNMGHNTIGMQTTLLHDAAYRNDSGLVQKLLAARAALDSLDKHGMTALHIAIRSRREGIARLLLAARCDTSIVLPGAGLTAADLAAKNNMQSLIPLLKN